MTWYGYVNLQKKNITTYKSNKHYKSMLRVGK